MAVVLLDYDDALSLVNDEVAKEGPDYVYPYQFCTNIRLVTPTVDEWRGSCLVGRALLAAGVTVDDFLASATEAESIDVVQRSGLVKLTRKASLFLSHVQQTQDMGGGWGEAVYQAVAAANYEDINYDDEQYI